MASLIERGPVGYNTHGERQRWGSELPAASTFAPRELDFHYTRGSKQTLGIQAELLIARSYNTVGWWLERSVIHCIIRGNTKYIKLFSNIKPCFPASRGPSEPLCSSPHGLQVPWSSYHTPLCFMQPPPHTTMFALSDDPTFYYLDKWGHLTHGFFFFWLKAVICATHTLYFIPCYVFHPLSLPAFIVNLPITSGASLKA